MALSNKPIESKLDLFCEENLYSHNISSRRSQSDQLDLAIGPRFKMSLSNNIYVLKGQYRRLNSQELNIINSKSVSTYSLVVTDTYEYHDNIKDIHITVNPGFLSNGCNVLPDIDSSSWIVHDYLYATHEYDNDMTCSQYEADHIMYDILCYENTWTTKIVAFLYKIAITLNPFYLFTKAWNSSGSRGPEYFQYFY